MVVSFLGQCNAARMVLLIGAWSMALVNGFLLEFPSLSPVTRMTTPRFSSHRTRAGNDDFASSEDGSNSNSGNSDAMFLQSLRQRTAELHQKKQEIKTKWTKGDCRSSIPLVFPDWIRRLDVDYPLVACGSAKETIYIGHLETGKICFQSGSSQESVNNDGDEADEPQVSAQVLQRTLRSMFGKYDGGGTLSIAFSGSLICEGGRNGGVRVWRIDPDSQRLVSQGSIPAMKGLLATCLHLDESGDHLWVGTHNGEVHSYSLDNPLKPLGMQTKPDQVWHVGGATDHSCVLSLDFCPEFNYGVSSLASGSVKLFSTSVSKDATTPQEPVAALYPPFDSTERRSSNIYPSQAAFVKTRDRTAIKEKNGLSIAVGGSDGSMYLQEIALVDEHEIDAAPFQTPLVPMGQGHVGGGLVKAMISPSVNLLITMGQDGCLRVWDIPNRSPFYHFAGYKVWSGSIWSDGRRLISDGVDNCILCHDFAESEDDFSCGN